MIFHLAHDTARQRAMDAVRTAPAGWVVRVTEPNRSLEQNALIHAVLTEVGDILKWKFNGQEVDLDDLKSIFMAAYRKASGENVRFVMGIDGQPVILSWRTRDLKKKEAIDFCDSIFAWLEEHKRGL
jgi:hypothetical protein